MKKVNEINKNLINIAKSKHICVYCNTNSSKIVCIVCKTKLSSKYWECFLCGLFNNITSCNSCSNRSLDVYCMYCHSHSGMRINTEYCSICLLDKKPII